MPHTPRAARRALATAGGLALAATGLSLVPGPAQADPDGTALVISEVYGGGGNSGARYTHDYVELFNPTDAAIDLTGTSLQYRSSTNRGTAGSIAGLSGAVPAGEHFLVQLQSNDTTVGSPLPSPDLSTTAINLSGSNGQIFLASTTTGVDPDGAADAGVSDPAVVDLVGYGSAVLFEGSAAAPTPGGNDRSVSRDAAGTDTDDNAADFTAGTPSPGAAEPAGDPGDPGDPPQPRQVTIAEIQGSGTSSPLAGTEVVTEGVVTAAYPSGGFFGFYLQTPGTGGELDLATHTASQGIFVYQARGAGDVTVQPGQHVRVTGTAGEYAGQTQVTVDEPTDVVTLTEPAAAVSPVVTEWPSSDAEKESLEGMLFAPRGEFTVSNTYPTNQYGEVGLAVGDRPLIQPTEVADAQDLAAVAAVAADNAARAIVLDDGSSTNFIASSYSETSCGDRPVPCLFNGHLTPPYISNTEPVRVGAAATFTAPVVLAQGGDPDEPTYRFQPTATVVGPENATSPVTFEDTRTAGPDRALIDEEGTADLTVASFNVLNYFTTLGDADDDGTADGSCVAYYDRDDDGVTVRDDCALRGAWDPQDLDRQQDKIVAAINTLDADVVGLMEIESSATLGEEADEATRSLVAALNAAAGFEKWAANPSSADLPPVSERDVITNAIIYQPASVTRVGEARALGELSSEGEAFSNAREPIAQAFRSTDGGEPFLVVVNHFKSKGSGTDDGTGQGNANPDRIAQATALRDWVPGVQAELGVEATLLVGDFNAYTMEDPLQVLYEAGYTNVEQHSGNGEHTYSFAGQSGSLDHVLANAAAMELYTGVDIWNINAGEAVALEYSRWNYHSTAFHTDSPYRSSDHDPLVVGLDVVDPRTPSAIAVRATPKRVWADRTRVKLHVVVRTEAGDATGTVTVVSEGGTREATLHDGRARLRLAAFPSAGRQTVTVTYAGDEDTAGSEETITLRVRTHPRD